MAKKSLYGRALNATLIATLVGGAIAGASTINRIEKEKATKSEAASAARTAKMQMELKLGGATASAEKLRVQDTKNWMHTIARLEASREYEEHLHNKTGKNLNAKFTPQELIQAGYALGTLHAAYDHFITTNRPT